MVYILVERIHRGDEHVPVKKMKQKDNSGEDITGTPKTIIL